MDVTSGVVENTLSQLYDEHSPEVELSGNATVLPCNGCESGEIVGYIGFGGKFTIRRISGGKTSMRSVLISYANGDSTWRYATLRLKNGSQDTTWEKQITFPKTGGGQQTKQIVVQIPLEADLVTDLEIGNDSGYGPDIDFVTIENSRE